MLDALFEQGKEEMLESICEWIRYHAVEYLEYDSYNGAYYDKERMIYDLRKTMLK